MLLNMLKMVQVYYGHKDQLYILQQLLLVNLNQHRHLDDYYLQTYDLVLSLIHI